MDVRVGLVGTGYVARVRAAAFTEDERSQLVAVSGADTSRAKAFAASYGAKCVDRWQDLVASEHIDLVVVATVSSLHGAVVEAALELGKHVVVEYPLSLDVAQATRLVTTAQEKELLLHIEHIELLGGLHQAMRSHLSRIGEVCYARYRTLTPKRPAPKSWKYHRQQFGFPFCGALSRVNRLTNLLGEVEAVSCSTRITVDNSDPAYVKSLWSMGWLKFASGALAELTYAKGEEVWLAAREIEMQGTLGALSFVGNEGRLATDAGSHSISVVPRRGLLAEDTAAVLDFLTEGRSLYVSAQESLYALRVGDALRQSSEKGQTVYL